jgi:hypothetical protein
MNIPRAANDDPKARLEALQRRALDLQTLAAYATAEQEDAIVDELRAINAELEEMNAELRRQSADLARQLRELGEPTMRRVVADTNGNTVVF